MNLRLVILEDTRTQGLKVVHPTYPVAHGFRLNEKEGTWTNGYSDNHMHRIGSWDYWSGYRKGTVVAVIDPREIDHLTTLANLSSAIEEKRRYDRMPSRDT